MVEFERGIRTVEARLLALEKRELEAFIKDAIAQVPAPISASFLIEFEVKDGIKVTPIQGGHTARKHQAGMRG